MGLRMGAVIRERLLVLSSGSITLHVMPIEHGSKLPVACHTVLGVLWSLLPEVAPSLLIQIFDLRHSIVMYTATRNGPSTSAPGDGSRTLTITNNPTREDNDDEQGDDPEGGHIIGTLRLRTTRLTGSRVAWDEDVIDNEGIGKKKSKSKFLSFYPILIFFFI